MSTNAATATLGTAPYQAGVRDYLALLKPRVMSLVVFTGIVGLVIAPGPISPVLGFVAVLCIAVGAGASGALNMWYDADIDRRMARTRGRPIPSGKVPPGDALAFGMVLAAGSVLVMGLFVNYVAAGLLAFTIFFYVVIYTMWLKRLTPQNIVIGGAAGALPPVIGWAAVTGAIAWQPLVLFAIIFIWTPPHFWALSLFSKSDYEAAAVPMMPVAQGADETRRQIVIYSLLLAPLGVAPFFAGFAGVSYGIVSALLGGVFLWLAFAVARARDPAAPGRLFAYSILYLFALFAVLLIEHMLGLA